MAKSAFQFITSVTVLWHQLGASVNATSPVWGFLSECHTLQKLQVIVFIDNYFIGVSLACHNCASLYTASSEM